jgi:recombinational DNA repair protein RecT
MTAPQKAQPTTQTVEREPSLLDKIVAETERLRADILPMRDELVQAAPKWFGVDRIFAGLMAAAVKTPEIFKADRKSLYLALMRVARWGLDIGDGVDLVIVKKKVRGQNGQPDSWTDSVEAWPDYKGLKALAIRQGLIRNSQEYVVYEDETFEYEEGLRPILRHQPKAGNAGRKMVAFYSIIALPKNQPNTFNLVWFDEVEKRRAKSKGWNDAALQKKGEPTGCPPWYGKKTAIRDYLNRQPKSGILGGALQAGEDEPNPDLVRMVDVATGEVLDAEVNRDPRD